MMCTYLAKICRVRSANCFIYSFVIEVIISDRCKNNMYERVCWQLQRHFYMKTIVTLIPTNLDTYLLLFLFCPFLESKNKNEIFSKMWSGN